MPELPEVETVKKVLEPQLAGRKIVEVNIMKSDVVAHPSTDEFRATILNSNIVDMDRRGKFLLINLSGGNVLIIHLRMTGQLLVTPSNFPQEKHTHLVFHLDDGNQLRYIDVRRFGRFWLKGVNEEDTFSGVAKLGLEPFDEKCNADYLYRSFGKSKKTIKECLLDQNIVTGIGNIYSDEILFDAKILPSRTANSLKMFEWQALEKSIPTILKLMIEKNSIAPEEYLATQGKKYNNTPFLKIYGHKGDPCPGCHTPLLKIVIAGRSCCYCVNCQS